VKNVIFLAPPLAGKGTFSDYLEKRFGYQHYSTGSILRERALHDEKIRQILLSGELVSDEIIMGLVDDVLKKSKHNVPFILDGIPRTLQQAKKLDIILSGLEISNYVVVFIDVEEDILIDRVIGRKVCPTCHQSYNMKNEEFKPKVDNVCDFCSSTLVTREDDNLESFKVRYQKYLESVKPIKAYYEEKGCLKVIYNNELDQTEALNQLWGVLSEH